MKILYDEAKAVQSEKNEKKRFRRWNICFLLVLVITGLFIACCDIGTYLHVIFKSRLVSIVGILGLTICGGVIMVLYKLLNDTPPDVKYRKLLKSHTVLEAKTLYDPEGILMLCVTVEDDYHVVSKKYIPLPKGKIQSSDVSEPTVNLHDGAYYVPH